MKNSKNGHIVLLVIIMFASICTSMVTSINIINKMTIENSEQKTHIISSQIRDSIASMIMRPVTISETMAHNDSLIKIMRTAKKSKSEDIEQEMAEFLNSIRTGFGYQMVFAVCNETKAYYTYNGLSNVVDTKNNDFDIWYKNFCDTGKYYDLNVDTNKANNWGLSIFVNTQVRDKNGSFLGICGVAIEMEQLQKLFKQYEQDYNVKINLIDHDYLIEVDSDRDKIGKSYLTVSDLTTLNNDEFRFEKVNKQLVVTQYMKELDWYLVIQNKGIKKIEVLTIVGPSIIILLIGLFVMGVTLYLLYYRGKKIEGVLTQKVEIGRKQMRILNTMAGIYLSSHVINLKEDTVEELSTAEHVRLKVNHEENANQQMIDVMRYTVSKEDLDEALTFCDLSTLAERLKDTKILVAEFVGNFNGWFRAQFIVNSYDRVGNIETVIFTTQVIDAEKRQEENLVKISVTDELTGLYNRRAYDRKIHELENNIPENLVVIAMDINGLKTANDTQGHEAGDELIRGAAICVLSEIVDKGKVYRTGGDEFIAIVTLKQDEINTLLNRIKKHIKKWRGMIIKELSISFGVASHNEYPDYDINELVAQADKHMYADKSLYYKASGKERRK